MNTSKLNILLSLILFQIFFCINGVLAEQPSITVYAAASLTGPIKEISQKFEDDTGLMVKTNFASSGNLARQIEQGAPADVYLSASQKWMNYAQENASIDPKTRINLIANAIVLVSPIEDNPIKIKFTKEFSFADAFAGKFSIGDPDHVPAGKYAQQSLESLGWWKDMESRLIRAKDVRQALMIVEAGEVKLGTVFKSDAIKSSKVQMVGEFPINTHSPIIYAAALCSQSSKTEKGDQFLKYLTSEKAQKIFVNYGFQKVK